MTVAIISHPDCLLHDHGRRHPERRARLEAIEDQLVGTGLESWLLRRDAPLVQREALLRVHDAAYVDWVEQQSPVSGHVSLDLDTAMGPNSLSAARRAAGAAVMAVDLVLDGSAAAAFACVRPPGHHAEPDRSMGFCIFNNVAVAAAHVLAGGAVTRVAILDFDIHHGNGTEAMFRNDPRVLFCSTFQHPLFPYTDPADTGPGIIKAPLPANADGDALRRAVETHWAEPLAAFAPELILVSAGFDGHYEDHLSDTLLHTDDYTWITRWICERAAEHSGGRIVSVLEGGYALSALARSTAAHIKVLTAGCDR